MGTLEAHFWVQVPPIKSPHNLKVRRPFYESSDRILVALTRVARASRAVL